MGFSRVGWFPKASSLGWTASFGLECLEEVGEGLDDAGDGLECLEEVGEGLDDASDGLECLDDAGDGLGPGGGRRGSG